MLNFLALLGWSPGDDTEVMTVPQLIERFSVHGLHAILRHAHQCSGLRRVPQLLVFAAPQRRDAVGRHALVRIDVEAAKAHAIERNQTTEGRQPQFPRRAGRDRIDRTLRQSVRNRPQARLVRGCRRRPAGLQARLQAQPQTSQPDEHHLRMI